MSTNNRRINVSELDFDKIKDNLKDYLRGQEEFKDYDFEGSGLSILLDVLAYNTHYNNLYTNLAVNESFLDSASKRSSVVSIAKSLGYTPRSATCAQAVVNIRVVNPTSFPSIATLPSYSEFNTTVDGVNYTFYNTSSHTATSGVNGYVFSDVELVEGLSINFSFTAATGGKYIIPNQFVDTSTIRVTVKESAVSGTFETWNQASNIIDSVDGTTKIYFIKEVEGGLYELTFGDDIIGKSLDNGNVISVDYFISGLSAANGARLFDYGGAALIGGTTSVSTKTVAFGGGASEDINSIKYNAPRSYAAQNRAVTLDDYRSLILSKFSSAKSVACWGGEDNDPPIYGKVFISISHKELDKLTTAEKEYILLNVLSKRSVVSVSHEIIDPEYINVVLNITSNYNINETNKTASELKTIITSSVLQYEIDDLQTFDSVFRHSKLLRLVDDSEPSIVNSTITVLIKRKVSVKYDTSAEYILNIINPIYASGDPEESIISNGFYIKHSTEIHYLDDDGLGFIRLYKSDDTGDKIIVNSSIGSVNYDTGYITVSNLNITSLVNSSFEFTIKPKSNDIVSALHQIVQIDADNLTVIAIPDATSSGDFAAGFNYTFTSSRA